LLGELTDDLCFGVASSKQIASRLGIVPASVDTYRSRLMFKLDVKGVAGLVRFAIRHSVVEP
jgi:DNA-binding CsgD family transcriptional regulator